MVVSYQKSPRALVIPAPTTVRFIHPWAWTEGSLMVLSARFFAVIAVIYCPFL